MGFAERAASPHSHFTPVLHKSSMESAARSRKGERGIDKSVNGRQYRVKVK